MGTRSRRTVDVRRDEILASTTDLVDRLGLAALRVADVAKELGVSPALVFYHFGTKDALVADAFTYAVERDMSRVDAAVAKANNPLDKMRRALKSYGPTGAAAGWRIWIDAWALAQREPTIGAVLRGFDERWRSVLQAIITEGVQSGDFTCTDPEASVAQISASLDGLSVAALVYRSVTRVQLRQWMREGIAREIGIDPAALA
ncbi:MAG: TetR/AcrR family transcriptional regulator [Nocardioidaceae bacterium]|nr:MAG: TetR/AcrR family transcriptional regulator [Nocardioidaceae bacterium]